MKLKGRVCVFVVVVILNVVLMLHSRLVLYEAMPITEVQQSVKKQAESKSLMLPIPIYTTIRLILAKREDFNLFIVLQEGKVMF